MSRDRLPCTRCGHAIDLDGPAIGESRDQCHNEAWTAYFIPIVSDLRGGPTQIFHLACYAEERGSAALNALVPR